MRWSCNDLNPNAPQVAIRGTFRFGIGCVRVNCIVPLEIAQHLATFLSDCGPSEDAAMIAPSHFEPFTTALTASSMVWHRYASPGHVSKNSLCACVICLPGDFTSSAMERPRKPTNRSTGSLI